MAWRRYVTSMELALTLLSARPLTLEELRLYYRFLVVRGLQVVGGWDDVESTVRSMISRGLARTTPDGRIYIDRASLPDDTRLLIEENIKMIRGLLAPPGGA